MKKFLKLLAGILASTLLLGGCQSAPADNLSVSGTASLPSAASVSSATATDGKQSASVWYFDVGQGDSELVRLPNGKNLLIDAGTTESGPHLVKLIKDMGITKLDMVIATHPHADHIGGMLKIVENFEIGTFYMPRIADKDVPTTKTYTDLLKGIQRKRIPTVAAKAGISLLQEKSCSVRLLAPKLAQYKEMNNYSAVAMVTIGEKKFLFTGDAQKESETEMLKSGAALHADVLKCGHHGSKTSTTVSFLKAVSPSAAVISCGRGNDYGFPTQQTLTRLKSGGIRIYRTDEQKTICAHTDGKTIQFETGLPSATTT